MSDSPRRLVICNPQARRSRRQSAADYVQGLLRQRGLPAEVEAIGDRREAIAQARQAAAAGYEQVIAAGGDGTVNAVANGLAGSDTALGVLPLGTGNILAYNLGLVRLDQALEAIAGGESRHLDLGWINDRHFVALAGVGFEAQVASSVDPGWKQHTGRFAFFIEGLITGFRDRPHIFQVQASGETEFTVEERMWSALVLNCPEFTWKVPVARQADPGDGWLDLILVRDASAWELLYGLSSLLLKIHDISQVPGISVHRVRSVHLETEPAWLWQADGDVGGETPVEIEVRPGALRVLVPPQ